MRRVSYQSMLGGPAGGDQGAVYVRLGDGAIATSCGGPDCDDTDGGINPGAVDACGNGVDEDCYGGDALCTCSDDADGDGHVAIACGGGKRAVTRHRRVLRRFARARILRSRR